MSTTAVPVADYHIARSLAASSRELWPESCNRWYTATVNAHNTHCNEDELSDILLGWVKINPTEAYNWFSDQW